MKNTLFHICDIFYSHSSTAKLTVEHCHTADGEVEEETSPLTRVDHGEHDGRHEHHDLHQKGPDYPGGQSSSENQ